MSKATPIALGSSAPPPAAVMRMLALHSREQLEGFVEVAIGLLDLVDGDPDVEGIDDDAEPVDDDTELNGDERDSSNAEDECLAGYVPHEGPGCPIADSDMGVEGE